MSAGPTGVNRSADSTTGASSGEPDLSIPGTEDRKKQGLGSNLSVDNLELVDVKDWNDVKTIVTNIYSAPPTSMRIKLGGILDPDMKNNIKTFLHQIHNSSMTDALERYNSLIDDELAPGTPTEDNKIEASNINASKDTIPVLTEVYDLSSVSKENLAKAVNEHLGQMASRANTLEKKNKDLPPEEQSRVAVIVGNEIPLEDLLQSCRKISSTLVGQEGQNALQVWHKQDNTPFEVDIPSPYTSYSPEDIKDLLKRLDDHSPIGNFSDDLVTPDESSQFKKLTDKQKEVEKLKAELEAENEKREEELKKLTAEEAEAKKALHDEENKTDEAKEKVLKAEEAAKALRETISKTKDTDHETLKALEDELKEKVDSYQRAQEMAAKLKEAFNKGTTDELILSFETRTRAEA